MNCVTKVLIKKQWHLFTCLVTSLVTCLVTICEISLYYLPCLLKLYYYSRGNKAAANLRPTVAQLFYSDQVIPYMSISMEWHAIAQMWPSNLSFILCFSLVNYLHLLSKYEFLWCRFEYTICLGVFISSVLTTGIRKYHDKCE